MILSLLMSAAASEPTFTPELQVRPRFEADTGEDAAAGGERFFVLQRSRLGGSVDFGMVTARAVVQDARVWGSEEDTGKVTAEDLDFRIASLKFKPADGVAVTVGRQEIRWHEQRLIAIAYWQPVGRVFDAVRLDLKGDAFHFQGFGAITAEGDVEAFDEDSVSAGGIGGLYGEAGMVDAIYLLDADNSTDHARHTIGLYAKGKQGILSGRFEGYHQRGTSGGADLSTLMLGVQGTIEPPVSGKPAITLWYDWLSGDDDLTDTQSTAFVMVYGAKHKFMGVADIIYYQVGGPNDGLGLHNPALKLRVSPAESLKLHLDAHTFLAATDASSLGNEVDLKAVYAVRDGVTLAAGSGVFLGVDDRPVDLFAWTQLDVRL